MPSTFSFDVGTPYTYLAAERVGRVGRTSRCDRSSLRLLSLPMCNPAARAERALAPPAPRAGPHAEAASVPTPPEAERRCVGKLENPHAA